MLQAEVKSLCGHSGDRVSQWINGPASPQAAFSLAEGCLLFSQDYEGCRSLGKPATSSGLCEQRAKSLCKMGITQSLLYWGPQEAVRNQSWL